jgi:hypothetical protein
LSAAQQGTEFYSIDEMVLFFQVLRQLGIPGHEKVPQTISLSVNKALNSFLTETWIAEYYYVIIFKTFTAMCGVELTRKRLWGRVTEGGMGFCSTQITYFTRVLYIAK